MFDVRVTVIVPVYNVEKYIRECLDSLVRQTLKGVEVIIVNDGSTDGSGDIAKDYSEKNDNFILINRINGGLSAARNTGLEVARGEYVYFLDSDDFIADNALEKLYKRAKNENLDQLRFVAYTFEDGTKEYKWSRDVNQSEYGYKYLGDYPNVMNGVEFYRRTLDNGDYYPSCCLIFSKREVIEKNGLRFYEGILHEDNLFNFQFTSLCDRVAVLNEPLYYRRWRPGSITKSINCLEKNRAMCISAEEADKFIDVHPNIKEQIGCWQISFFIHMMLYHWQQMNREEQDSKESREHFSRVKPLIKKYNIGGRSLRLFYLSHSLYRLYRWVRGTA